MRDCRIPAWLAAMVSVWCAIERMLNPERRFSGGVSRMYFLHRAELRGASTRLVQQSVIVASHDLTLVVRPFPPPTTAIRWVEETPAELQKEKTEVLVLQRSVHS